MKTFRTSYIFIVLLYVIPFILPAQNNWNWSVNITPDTASSTESILPHELFVDDESVYTFGIMNEEARIADTVLYKKNNSSVTLHEYFVSKFNAEGDFQWAANEGLNARRIVVSRDNQGNFHIAGSAQYDLFFQNDTLDYNDGEIFYARYSSDWEELYVRQLNVVTTSSGFASTVLGNAVDDEGNLFIYFLSNGQVTFPGEEFPPTGSGFEPRYFIVKFNAADEFQWAKQIDSDFINHMDLETDSDGDLIIGGTYRDFLSIESQTVYTAMNSSGNQDIFLGKISKDGDLLWLKDFGNSQSNYCNDLKIDKDNFIYINGTLDGGELMFDNQIIDSYYLDPFIAKFSPEGNTEWVFLELRNSIFDAGRNLFLYDNKIITAGEYKNPISFPSGADSTLTYKGGKDMYVAIYDNNGFFESVNTTYGNCDEYPKDIFVSDDRVYTLGAYNCHTLIGEDSLFTENIQGFPVLNQYNTFVAAFDLSTEGVSSSNTNVKNDEFKIYPNPTTGEVFFDLGNISLTGINPKIKITDLSGKTLFYKNMNRNDLKVNFNNITQQTGIFLVTIITDTKVFVQKVILIN